MCDEMVKLCPSSLSPNVRLSFGGISTIPKDIKVSSAA
ncbi:hypothetical protein FRUB_06701 [Fimbriiglobus ruber]|uniref:Uncharacterized protein n=1 Tax=Fimbriiglobus ruber TaxID=1908690 RepID=A0A225D7P4_9BACT|nr:hypothetical protein FRUB_06701 [Fimbriiglobus ruber]